MPPVKEYWPRLAEICQRHGVLLIADEVMTGFGRTGRRFAVDHWNVIPDILVGGKGLTGGYMPMGMIAVQESLVEQCEAKGADFMFYTYSSHPTACAVADRVLEIMEREHLVERAAEMGARLGAQLKEELSGHPMVGDIRGTGMFWGVEMVRDRASRAPYPAGDEGREQGGRGGAQARAVRLSGDRDGAAGRRRGDGHAAVCDRRPTRSSTS